MVVSYGGESHGSGGHPWPAAAPFLAEPLVPWSVEGCRDGQAATTTGLRIDLRLSQHPVRQ